MDPERYYSYADIRDPNKLSNRKPNPQAANSDQLDLANSAEADPSTDSTDAPSVVYALDQLSIKRPGPVLVVGYGTPLKNIVRAATAAEVKPLYATGTDDKLRAFSFNGQANVVSIGKNFNEKLFESDYAIAEAAKSCGAKTILWAENNPPSDLLRWDCEKSNILLLVPAPGDKTLSSWERASLDASQEAKLEDHPYPIEWRKCAKCGLSNDNEIAKVNDWTCPSCGKLYRLTTDERIASIFDEGTFEEWDFDVEESNPMEYPDYDAVIERARTNSGHKEAVRCGKGKIEGAEAACAIMEPTFIMGSMGRYVGEMISCAIERATKERLPFIAFCASGGARMQEGLMSLMQMAKTSAALEAHDREGLLYIAVLTDPTTGGVTASFATLGDIILAEPGTLIGFAGRRVIQDTIKQALPDDFQTAEFALEHGIIDAIVERQDMKRVLGQLLQAHDYDASDAEKLTRELDSMGGLTTIIENVASDSSAADDAQAADDGNAGKGNGAFRNLINGLSEIANSVGKTLSEQTSNATLWWAVRNQGVADAPYMKPDRSSMSSAKPSGSKGEDAEQSNPAWDSVRLARNTQRPTSAFYIASIFDDFIELHGDRAYADDGAIIGGIARINGIPVTIIAEEKGATLKDRISRNFGCPQPEGYRKAQRLMKQADKFGRPVICFVDTQGAYCGQEAEERGMGGAIAESLALMSSLKVPVISIILGEGGSGGALALAVANKVAMLENAVYSVLSPEGFASILWKDGSRAPEAASVMKMNAHEVMGMGIIEDVIPEGQGPAHENPDQAAAAVWLYLTNTLRDLQRMSPEELRDQRYDRFRSF